MAQASQDSSLIRTNFEEGIPLQKIWQTSSDDPLRREMVESILHLFLGTKPLAPEWRLKIEVFVKLLEQEMYCYAETKEEYVDLKTLEGRLQNIAKSRRSGIQVQQGPMEQLLDKEVKVEPASGVVGEFFSQEQGTPCQVVSTIKKASSSKSTKSKIVRTSLVEAFTPEMILVHLASLQQSFEQIKSNAENNHPPEHHLSENACSLCEVEKLSFEPPIIYCTECGIAIESYAVYYTEALGGSISYCCTACYNVKTSDMKATFQTRQNDKEKDESWVQCHKCKKRNHQICALYNGRLNEDAEAIHTCAKCLISEIGSGIRKMLPISTVLGAKDLPKTFLSDHLEERLTLKLEQERTERAKALNKSVEDIPGADGLVVRVVSSVEKKLKVKKCLLELFEEEYPREFLYKSKVLLLFQKIEGVDVCLFGMYVHEFGAECENPNKLCVYLAYLDSVKYFTPDIKAASGEALRTYVYHEILIGYLDYCKRRGFGSFYIWACPPIKGDDFIFNRHPEIQKTPKSDELRKWYLNMIQKARNDGVVVQTTNLYDYYFVSKGECKTKVTTAALPYFDGDYWPAAMEKILVKLQQAEEEHERKNRKRTTKRTSVSARKVSKDLLLMKELGKSISRVKKDCILVQMHYACTHCRSFIVSGYFWACKKCKNFKICNSCYDAELSLDKRERHPIGRKEAHELTSVQVNQVPVEAKDEDYLMESELFDSRQAFVSHCKGNYYQYDTLRRAKHSSMMLLYHLHNPTASAFVITCNSCLSEIETGAGWRCVSCEDFDLCKNCRYLSQHQHMLTPHPSLSEWNPQKKGARQRLQMILVLLVHASQCGTPGCRYFNCQNIKAIFRHGRSCEVRSRGGCIHCKRMWGLLKLHARDCKESRCQVPRCKDLKESMCKSLQQEESNRRALVLATMKQSATAEGGA